MNSAKGEEKTGYYRGLQYAFDAYCKKVLRNYARDIQRKKKRCLQRQIYFSELDTHQIDTKLICHEEYICETDFIAWGCPIKLNNCQLIHALCKIETTKREIIFLSFFIGLKDFEIADMMRIPKSTVQYRRKRALEEIKHNMED